MLRKSFFTPYLTIPLAGCGVIMLGNVVMNCAIRPEPILLPGSRPVATASRWTEIRGQVLQGYGITSSMSRRGNCWDNACSETLFGSLKVDDYMASGLVLAATQKTRL